MPKKYLKLMAKSSLNDAKMDTKINENSYFSEMLQTICFTIENVILDI